MAKGDQPRAQRTINEQGPLAQNYLTGQQQNVGGTTGQLQNVYFGNQQQMGGGGQDYEAVIKQLTAGKPPNPQTLKSLEPELNKHGIKLLPNAKGIATGWVQLPDGRKIDIGTSFSTGDPNRMKWGFHDPTGGLAAGAGGGVLGQNLADYANIMGKYGEFARTGGFSPADLANIRARATSPTRGIYARMQENMNRQRALQGGYAPNYMAASSRLAREGTQQISDINRATEADIAEMVQRGRLAGMGGMAGMYGATPGLSEMFGRQVLQSQGQGIDLAGMQNQLALGRIRAQQEQANIPGNWQQAMSNIGGGLDLVGSFGNAIYPWMQGGGGEEEQQRLPGEVRY